jgi:hypothetical protein
MNAKLLLILFLCLVHVTAAADSNEANHQLDSQYGDIVACDMPSYAFSDRDILDCLLPGANDIETSRIIFNGETIWSDSTRQLRFAKKYISLNADESEIETFVFYTSSGGTSCPMELTVVVTSPNGVKVEGAFGNCMDSDGIRIEPVSNGVHFLFACGVPPVCETQQTGYAYHCFVSNDINQKMTCSGNSFCSGYTENVNSKFFYWSDNKQRVDIGQHCNLLP